MRLASFTNNGLNTQIQLDKMGIRTASLGPDLVIQKVIFNFKGLCILLI